MTEYIANFVDSNYKESVDSENYKVFIHYCLKEITKRLDVPYELESINLIANSRLGCNLNELLDRIIHFASSTNIYKELSENPKHIPLVCIHEEYAASFCELNNIHEPKLGR